MTMLLLNIGRSGICIETYIKASDINSSRDILPGNDTNHVIDVHCNMENSWGMRFCRRAEYHNQDHRDRIAFSDAGGYNTQDRNEN